MSLKDLLHPKSEGATFVRDIILILLVVAGIGIVLFGVSGTWPALVAVESGSMEPNLPTYSLVFVVDENRFGDWMTQDEAEAADTHKVFNEYGDVIVYQPNGMKGVTPIIHRAITTVTKEEAQALGFTGDAAHSGVITKGDNEITNPYPDQFGSFPSYGISRMEPVKEEWIVGKAVFAIPLIGWVPIHIIESILIAAAVIICIEIVSRIVSKRKSRKR
ncbi:MAG TPA: S26 family signal peptidase [Methanocorpusculum sp.]|nr:S26 family signal peptidase [Methanocorpusculum sp.]HJJ81031.1 S26 family signal peptidase [Methanocorpusculum sp.]